MLFHKTAYIVLYFSASKLKGIRKPKTQNFVENLLEMEKNKKKKAETK